jgi:hypothetical protein
MFELLNLKSMLWFENQIWYGVTVTREMSEVVDEGSTAHATPPARRGSREDRREATLRAFTAGGDARCAYCGRPLPAIPARGGRPTPYCPADPDRYGQWGAKVITCAMLDECREIWVSTYGADQPMTQVDVAVLDQRAGTLLAALDAVREEVGALHARVGDETAAALAAKAGAEQAQAQAQAQARQALAESAQALAEVAQARRQAEDDRAQLRTARELADRAIQDKDHALAQRQAAENDKSKAEADRQRALDHVSAAQDRIAELQTALAGERATILERLDQLRREHDQARADLRTTLTTEHEQRLRARTDELNEQAHALSAAADHRVTELTSRLTQATQTYADALGPLHSQLGRLRDDLTEQTAAANTARRQLDDLRRTLNQALNHTTEDQPLRQRVAAALGNPPVRPT